jgi:hypothetical protein
MARAPKRPRDCSGPGTYKVAVTNIKMAILRKTYPEDKLMKMTWKKWVGCYMGLQ